MEASESADAGLWSLDSAGTGKSLKTGGSRTENFFGTSIPYFLEFFLRQLAGPGFLDARAPPSISGCKVYVPDPVHEMS
jgi:hypothetical protein